MVRYCVVSNCGCSDNQILCHRFPRNSQQAEVWRNVLALRNYSLYDLQRKYVVCTRHFELKEYRSPVSNCLNTTAIPTLNPKVTRSLTEFIEPVNSAGIDETHNAEDNEPMLLNRQEDLDDNFNFALSETADCIVEDCEERDEEVLPHIDKNCVNKRDDFHKMLLDYLNKSGTIEEYQEKLTHMAHDDLADEALTARRLIEDMWKYLQLHESVHKDIEIILMKLK